MFNPAAASTAPATATELDELEILKTRARTMGIVFSNNIGVSTLREKIEAKMAETTVTSGNQTNPLESGAGATGASNQANVEPTATPSLREYLLKSEMALVRVRITNLDPKKKDLPGEIITVANQYIGTVRKYVPFGEVTDNGYHVPQCIFKVLDSRRFLNIRTIRDAKSGRIRVETNYAKEFALEVLPQLTNEELNQLAANQAAGRNVD